MKDRMFFVNKACLDCGQLKCVCGKRRYERRWVTDYRPLNGLTSQDAYPIPSIRDQVAGTRPQVIRQVRH